MCVCVPDFYAMNLLSVPFTFALITLLFKCLEILNNFLRLIPLITSCTSGEGKGSSGTGWPSCKSVKARTIR